MELPSPFHWTEGVSSGGWDIRLGIGAFGQRSVSRIFLRKIADGERWQKAWPESVNCALALSDIRAQIHRGTFNAEDWIAPPDPPTPPGWGRF